MFSVSAEADGSRRGSGSCGLYLLFLKSGTIKITMIIAAAKTAKTAFFKIKPPYALYHKGGLYHKLRLFVSKAYILTWLVFFGAVIPSADMDSKPCLFYSIIAERIVFGFGVIFAAL